MMLPPASLAASDGSPVRKRAAQDRMQRLDADLVLDDQLALMDVFESSSAAADSYMMIHPDKVELRKAWIRKRLAKVALE